MLVDFPQQRFWVDYIQEADVSTSDRRPQNADDSIMTDEGALARAVSKLHYTAHHPPLYPIKADAYSGPVPERLPATAAKP